MITLHQSTELLASVYNVSEHRLQDVRKRLASVGMLPVAKGRSLPEATPERVALLLLGLGLSDPERIAETADLRRFHHMPNDEPDAPTLGKILAFTMKGLMERPKVGLDMQLVVTHTGAPWAHINAAGQTAYMFGEPNPSDTFLVTTTAISLAPLAQYCDAARAMAPPFKVAK